MKYFNTGVKINYVHSPILLGWKNFVTNYYIIL